MYCKICRAPYTHCENHICTDLKPKRTISLEAYIKMQCDVACMLRASGQSFNQSGAKEMVDMILEHNSVEVG